MATMARSNSGGLRMYAAMLACLLVAGMVGLLLFSTPAPAPVPEAIRPRAHAVERHGTSALTARLAIRQCGNGLRVYKCPETEVYAPTFIYLCEAVGSTDCAGVIVGSLGAEFTAWVGPCTRWDQIVVACEQTTVQTAPIIQWAPVSAEEEYDD